MFSLFSVVQRSSRSTMVVLRVMLVSVFVVYCSAQCGSDPDPALCNNVDGGSCGNACCKLLLFVEEDAATVKQQLEATLNSGGPDGYYSLDHPACQPLSPGCLNSTAQINDYSAFNITSEIGNVLYVGRAIHTAPKILYNDTIDLNIAPNTVFKEQFPWARTVIKAFSLSGVAGAFGDDGQNYYQITKLFLHTFRLPSWVHLDDSCPAPPGSNHSPLAPRARVPSPRQS